MPARDPARGAPRWLLVLLTSLSPVAVLVALELTLRLAGFGDDWPLFVSAPETPGHLQVNPEVARRFALDPDGGALATVDTIYFAAERPEGSLRLVVQGGSSAAGFPYGRFAGLAGMLGARLTAELLDRPVEVITTAMSAVNSYTLLDFVDEIIAQEPDAVLIYAGHNEYLGILGVGSAISAGRSRVLTLAVLELRGLRVFQLLRRGYAGLRGLSAGGNSPPEAEAGTLMAAVAREKEIPFGSELYARGLAQLRSNLGDLLAAYRRVGIPVYLATIASNLNDQEPFVSRLSPGTDADAWRARYEGGLAALERGDLAAAEADLDAAIALDEGGAAAHFARGRVLEARGEFGAALSAYGRARDLDQLRFRAPGAVNDILRSLAAEFGAVLVDAEAALAAESPHGIIGSELMLEHLHPNPRGYFLIADAFHRALRETGLVRGDAVSREWAWEWQPLTEVDRFAGDDRIAFLRAHWPFHSPAIPVELPTPRNRIEQLGRRVYERETSWTEATTSALSIYREGDERNPREAARVAVDLAATYPLAASAQATAGQLLVPVGRGRESVLYFERALRLSPRDPQLMLALASTLALTGQVERAREIVDALLELAPADRSAIALRARLEDR